jgi:AbrB family looped-hinge helix DNA binding protein
MTKRLKVRVDPQGRMVIPASVRARMGLDQGGEVTMELDEDSLRLRSHHQALRRIQELVRQYVPADVSLADELIAERRAEAARENEE